MHKARILVTLRCPRNCEYCCNKHEKPFENAIYFNKLGELPREDISEVVISGGEPALATDRCIEVLKYFEFHRVYLHTAMWTKELQSFSADFDGINYTLHSKSTETDIERFNRLQYWLSYSQPLDTTNRLLISPYVCQTVSFKPWLFDRVEMKPFLDECPLPEGEVLYVWKE